MPAGDPKGVALTPAAHERVSRVVRKVEGASPGKFRSGPAHTLPNQTKLSYPTTDVQPGTFAHTTFGVYESTAAGSTPTEYRGGGSSASSVAVYDYWGYGFNKRAKAMAFRPTPAKHWYGWQPPAASWGYVSAVGTNSCEVNPSTAFGISGDAATTFTVTLPTRSGIGVQLSVGDVIAYMPTHWGGYVAVSDYSSQGAGGGGGGGGGGIAKAGHFEMYPGFSFATTPTTTNPLDLGSWTGSTNLEGMGLSTTGTYTIQCTTPTKLLANFNATYRIINASAKGPLNTEATLYGNFYLNGAVQLPAARIVQVAQSTDALGNQWCGVISWEMFLDLSSGDTLYQIGGVVNAPAGSSANITYGTWSFIKIEEPDESKVQWAYVTTAPTTAGGCDSVQARPCTDCEGNGIDNFTTYTIKLPRRMGAAPRLTKGDVIAWENTVDADKVCVSDYSDRAHIGAYSRTGGVDLLTADSSGVEINFHGGSYFGTVGTSNLGFTSTGDRLQCERQGTFLVTYDITVERKTAGPASVPSSWVNIYGWWVQNIDALGSTIAINSAPTRYFTFHSTAVTGGGSSRTEFCNWAGQFFLSMSTGDRLAWRIASTGLSADGIIYNRGSHVSITKVKHATS